MEVAMDEPRRGRRCRQGGGLSDSPSERRVADPRVVCLLVEAVGISCGETSGSEVVNADQNTCCLVQAVSKVGRCEKGFARERGHQQAGDARLVAGVVGSQESRDRQIMVGE